MLMMFLVLSFLAAGTAIGQDAPNVIKIPNPVKSPIATKIPNLVKVPNVVGLPEPQARTVLGQIGLEEDEKRPATSSEECYGNKKGLVVRQDPAANEMVAPHSKVKLAWCSY